MKKLLLFYLLILFAIPLFGWFMETSVFAQVGGNIPKLTIGPPNPPIAKQPTTFSAINCKPGSLATFSWNNLDDPNSSLSPTINVGTDGKASYTHQAGFQTANYEIRVACGGSVSDWVRFKPTDDIGSCEYVNSLAINKASTGTPYIADKTTFTFKGQIANCANDNTVQLSRQRIRDEKGKSVDEPPVIIPPPFETDSNGNFSTDSPTTLPAGTWRILLQDLDGIGYLRGNNSLIITVEGTAGLKCNTPYGKNEPGKCPDKCPQRTAPGELPDGKFMCESEDDRTLRTGCNTPEKHLETLEKKCDEKKVLKDTVACGDNKEGISCENGTAICYKGEKKAENIKCETDKLLVEPTPTPPAPQCLEFEGEDDQGNPTGKCIKVKTAIGEIQTDVPGFIRSLFGILLSLSGGIALLIIIFSGYRLMTSQGDPEVIKEAQERITSVIVGILFLIFSLVILEIIGVDILALPGFTR